MKKLIAVLIMAFAVAAHADEQQVAASAVTPASSVADALESAEASAQEAQKQARADALASVDSAGMMDKSTFGQWVAKNKNPEIANGEDRYYLRAYNAMLADWSACVAQGAQLGDYPKRLQKVSVGSGVKTHMAIACLFPNGKTLVNEYTFVANPKGSPLAHSLLITSTVDDEPFAKETVSPEDEHFKCQLLCMTSKRDIQKRKEKLEAQAEAEAFNSQF